MTDNKLTSEELFDMFGSIIPMEAISIFHEPDPKKSVDDIRAELRVVAEKWKTDGGWHIAFMESKLSDAIMRRMVTTHDIGKWMFALEYAKTLKARVDEKPPHVTNPDSVTTLLICTELKNVIVDDFKTKTVIDFSEWVEKGVTERHIYAALSNIKNKYK